MPIRFFTDEDVYQAIALALRNAGFDALSTPETNRMGETDESQLRWATRQDRAIVTFNVGHFAQLHTEWTKLGLDHSGIVVSAQRPIGDTLHRLVHLANTVDREVMRKRLEFLSDW